MSSQTAEPLDVGRIRDEFPILEREVGDGQHLAYLDNAATSQTPDRVVDAMSDYYRGTNANVHRGIHHLSQEASIAYEEAHDRLAEFVGASGGREEMIFTKNTTEGLNLVAYAWGLNELGEGDEVVLSEMEHHSSLVTWQQIAKRTGADVQYIEIDDEGRLDMDHAREVIGPDTEMVSVTHVSNTLGTINPIGDLADLAHEHDSYIFADGAQAVPHQSVDVEALDVDFYAFSGHKMCGPTGIGGLYGKKAILEAMEPFMYGGGMVRKVEFEGTTWADLPWKYEAGTPLIAEGIALAEAADYLDEIGLDRIDRHERDLADYAVERLNEFDDIEIYGPPAGERAGLVSFNLDGVHAHDLASIMNDHGVAIRPGDHCTQPLHDVLGTAASARASFYLYNTEDEVDTLIEAIDDARQLFA
ncbi:MULTISPECIES: aminotransferase class V-fold PLP-dependent enzyme [Halococcus]|uniref:Cysteine desulfurase n=1 Tax=Halococcus salifodinae DSM 8989 TaxID=1227456 RepID=M0NBT4_9EURY|nr:MULTISPECIES: SufS family cysteine desulfurase [Halococcus]EMA55326.1 cysteine desulfurase, SufS subfamily protein [Halococcus salifodinae DSM 8989]